MKFALLANAKRRSVPTLALLAVAKCEASLALLADANRNATL